MATHGQTKVQARYSNKGRLLRPLNTLKKQRNIWLSDDDVSFIENKHGSLRDAIKTLTKGKNLPKPKREVDVWS